MMLPEYITPPTRKNDFFEFTRAKKLEDGAGPSGFQLIDPGLVSTECTTLKMGDGPVRIATPRRVAPSINHASKRINRECSRQVKLWRIAHDPYIRHLAQAARPQHKIRRRRRIIDLARYCTMFTATRRSLVLLRKAGVGSLLRQ